MSFSERLEAESLSSEKKNAWRWIDQNTDILEATNKKVHFLEHIKNELEIKNLNIVACRAEIAAQNTLYRERFDLVVARGVAKLTTLSELTLPFCKINGICVLHKGPKAKIEVAESLTAIEKLGGSKTELFPITHELDVPKNETVFVKLTKSMAVSYTHLTLPTKA